MLFALTNRIIFPSSKPGIYKGQNDAAISIFTQESFLKQILKKCEEGDQSSIISDLEKFRDVLLHFTSLSVTENNQLPSFLRIAVPHDFSVVNSGSFKDFAEEFHSIWTSEIQIYQRSNKSSLKRKHSETEEGTKIKETITSSAFPFKGRNPYSIFQVDPKVSRNVIMPLKGLNSSYLTQFVPCDLLNVHPHPDYFPVILLGEILSRTEGPLYTDIRGRGYAYGASVSVYLWHGQLSIEINKSSDPYKALSHFYKILEKLLSPDGFEEICSSFAIETAQSSVAYGWVSQRSTAGSCIATALRASLWVSFIILTNRDLIRWMIMRSIFRSSMKYRRKT